MLTLITPTRNRAKQFGHLEEYIRRQTYQGELQWLVINDGTEEYWYTQGQEFLLRDPSGDKLPSICENYLAALPLVRGDYILCVEDDDWYSEEFCRLMVEQLKLFDLVGPRPAFYYHVGSRKWRDMKNDVHTSLACTGFTKAVLPTFAQCCRAGSIYIDCALWSHWSITLDRSANLFLQDPDRPVMVGIKGQKTGARGLGLGHDPIPGIPDPDYKKLRQWLGDDSTNYSEAR